MSVLYINVPDWIQVQEPIWTRDNWAIDSARVLWRGPRTGSNGKDAFEKAIAAARWSSMPGFALMKLADWNTTIPSPSFPGVELHFIGIRDGKAPPVKMVDTTSVQTVTGSGINTSTKERVSGQITYRASRTCYEWYSLEAPPNVSQYATANNPVNPLNSQNVLAYSIQNDDTGRPVNSIPISSFVAVFNSLVLRHVVSTYERDPLIPNALWACKAEVDYKFIN